MAASIRDTPNPRKVASTTLAEDGLEVLGLAAPAVREGLEEEEEEEEEEVVWVEELPPPLLLDSTQRTKPLLVGASVWVMPPA